MKKSLFLILAIAIATTMNAQFYAGLGLGYGFGASKRVLGTETTGTTTITETNLYGSFGQGFNIQPKVGFMFNEMMGFELGIDYFMGATQTMSKTETSLKEGKSGGLILAPQFVLRTESGLYGRVGIFLPVAGKTIITESDSKYDMDGLGTYGQFDKETEMQGSFSLGLIGAFGYNYAISDNMNFFAELQYSAMSMKSGTAKVTKYEVGGKDQLANLPTIQKEVEFVDEVSSTDNIDPNVAFKMLKQTSPFSAIGVNIGITFSF